MPAHAGSADLGRASIGPSMREGRTLCQRRTVAGRGMHSGAPVAVHLMPARHPEGIRFLDAHSGAGVAACAANLRKGGRTLAIGGGAVRFSGIEHLLAACHGVGICCLRVEMEGGEAPGLDGSALDWLTAIDAAGLAPCGGETQPLVGPPTLVGEERASFIRYRPSAAPGFAIAYTVDFTSSGGDARHSLRLSLDESTFRTELAAARTFAVRGVDAEALAGIAAPPLWTDTPRESRRFPDELVRHKMLDLLGDLALLGRPLRGSLEADCAGHVLHQQLVLALAEAAAG